MNDWKNREDYEMKENRTEPNRKTDMKAKTKSAQKSEAGTATKAKTKSARNPAGTATSESEQDRQKRVRRILRKLDREYGTEHACFLHYETDWQLLFAVILSAQCTDARVNLVTAELYRKYPTLVSLAQLSEQQLEEEIRSTGFYHNKAKNIKACAEMLLSQYDGKVPQTMDELVGLPGVGRKTANVVRGELWKLPGVAVDTHVKRVTGKLGLTQSEDPVQIEKDLMRILPEDHWVLWNHDIITLGRTLCIAHRENCGECFLAEECPSCKEKKS